MNILTNNRRELAHWIELSSETNYFPTFEDIDEWTCEDIFEYMYMICPLVNYRNGKEMLIREFLYDEKELREVYEEFKDELRQIMEFEDMYFRYDDNENPDKEEPPAPIPFD